jgi:putative molybdopterin biosynthesis protein
MGEYLTTKETAALLRIKERTLYDLASKGSIPCSRATGKLLFERAAVEAWVAAGGAGGAAAAAPRPAVVLGSHDPLLDWALRESGCGLASYTDGSLDGLERFAAGEGVAAGLHLFDPETETWNIAAARARFAAQPAALIEWAWRQRGLMIAPDLAGTVRGVADLTGRRIAQRQAAAGGQALFERLLTEAGAAPDPGGPLARTETEAATAIVEGDADAAFGLEAVAARFKLAFVPVIRERFDLLVDRRAWFEPPLQTLFAFARTPAFATRAAAHPGYDVSGLGAVHFNGA